MEYLENLLRKDLRSILMPMIEETSPDRILQRASRLFALPVPSEEEALEQLMRGDARWPKCCALYQAGSARLARFKDICLEMAGHSDPLIRETASRALLSLGS